MSSKRCFRCLQTKPITAFYRHVQMKDGHLNKCIECTKADAIQHRLANLEHYRAYDRERSSRPDRVLARAAYRESDAFRMSHARAAKRWDVANAIRKRAAGKVSKAIASGLLSPQPCFIWGAKAQAHHPDYTAPLAVSWLCPKHHAQTHKEHREWMRAA